jgi:hypothetical protein
MAIKNDLLGGTDFVPGEILKAADLNDTNDAMYNVATNSVDALQASIIAIGDNVFNPYGQYKIVDTFTMANGQVGSVDTVNTTAALSTVGEFYTNYCSYWNTGKGSCVAYCCYGSISISYCVASASTNCVSGLVCARWTSTNICADSFDSLYFNYVGYTACVGSNFFCLDFSGTSVLCQNANGCIICHRAGIVQVKKIKPCCFEYYNKYDCYCNSAFRDVVINRGTFCATNLNYTIYSYACGQNASGCISLSNLQMNVNMIASIVAITEQNFEAAKNEILLAVVDTKENYDNITYDVLDASDTVLLCNGEPNKINALSAPTTSAKVNIKMANTKPNILKGYAYKML